MLKKQILVVNHFLKTTEFTERAIIATFLGSWQQIVYIRDELP